MAEHKLHSERHTDTDTRIHIHIHMAGNLTFTRAKNETLGIDSSTLSTVMNSVPMGISWGGGMLRKEGKK